MASRYLEESHTEVEGKERLEEVVEVLVKVCRPVSVQRERLRCYLDQPWCSEPGLICRLERMH